jgi:cell division protein FtsB
MKWLRLRKNKNQIIVIAVVIISVFLLMDLNSRVSEYFSVTSQRNKVGTEVAKLWQTQQVLKTQLAYAQSDAAAEEWAREEGYLIKPGDVRVIPLSAGEITPTPRSTAVPTPISAENWEIWKAVLLGE